MRSSRGLVHGLAVAAVFAGAVVSAGCGTGGLASEKADVSNGKQLFTEKCGSCHTLADAGTQGKIGPNLDDSFSGSRAQGFKESTIRNIIRDQILFAIEKPSGVITGPDGQEQPVQGMPQKLVTGQDAKDVAAYVASKAGLKAAGGQTTTTAPPPATATTTESTTTQGTTTAGGGSSALLTQGKKVFETAGCTGCHTLKDANATGNVGPNLDEAKPPKALVVDRVTNGKGVMPSFSGKLTAAEIAAVAAYVSAVAGM